MEAMLRFSVAVVDERVDAVLAEDAGEVGPFGLKRALRVEAGSSIRDVRWGPR